MFKFHEESIRGFIINVTVMKYLIVYLYKYQSIQIENTIYLPSAVTKSGMAKYLIIVNIT